MKFPRNARMLRSQLDAAPFAGVLFCLLIFILLCSLVYTPGVLIRLPSSNAELPDVDGPKVKVGLDANGNFYYENQFIPETNLLQVLKAEVARQEPGKLVLVLAADENVTRQQEAHVRDIAAAAGIRLIQEAVLPGMFDAPAKDRKKK